MADQVAVLRDGRLVQLTDPRTLYRRPGDLDVALFVGEAVVLDAEIRDGRAHCALGALAYEQTSGYPLADGAARVLLRPEQLRLSAPVSTRPTARVRSVDFYGHDSRVWLDLPGGLRGQRPAGGRRRALGGGRRGRHGPRDGAGLPARRRRGRAPCSPVPEELARCPRSRPDVLPGVHSWRLGKPKLRGVDLFLFTVDPRWGADVVAAGAAGIVVDWERRGKARRQLGEGTQINADTPTDLARMRAATDGRLLCRINGFGAVDRGRDRRGDRRRRRRDPAADGPPAEEVDRTLDMVAGRCGLGILIETQDAVAQAAALAAPAAVADLRRAQRPAHRPAARLELFRPLVDGTVDARPRRGGPALRRRRADAARRRLPGAERPAGRRAGPAGRRLHLPPPVVHRRHGRARPVRRGAPPAGVPRRRCARRRAVAGRRAARRLRRRPSDAPVPAVVALPA